MSEFPKDSAFAQEAEQRERFTEEKAKAFAERMANATLPMGPTTHEAALDLELLYQQLDRALSMIESGDLNNAYPLVEDVRDTLYQQLR